MVNENARGYGSAMACLCNMEAWRTEGFQDWIGGPERRGCKGHRRFQGGSKPCDFPNS